MNERPNLCDSLSTFVRTKLADVVDLFMVGVILVSLAVALVNHSFLLTSRLLAASLVASALCYLLASRSLRRCERVGFERIFLAGAAMVSGIWLFEVLYHYGWVESWQLFSESFTTFNINTPARRKPFPLIWAAIMVSVVLVGARYMRLNKWFYIVLGMGLSVLALWMAVGYPSHNQPWRSPELAEVIELIPPDLAHPSSPARPGWAFIVFWGGLFASAAKLLICTLPATLYMHHLQGDGKASSAKTDDILAYAWHWIRRPVLQGG